MNKTAIALVVVIVLAAVAGAGLYLTRNIDGLVKGLVEEIGTEAVGTAVRVAEVKVSLADGTATLSGLTVANPPGFSAEPLLRMDRVLITIDTSSLTGPVYVISDVTVEGLKVRTEQKGTGTNVQALLDGMPDDDHAATGEDEIRLAVSVMNFADGSMELHSEQFETQTVSMKAIQLRGLGSREKGLTPDEMGEEIASELIGELKDAAKAALGSYLRREAAAKLKEKLGSLFNRDKD